MRARSFAKAAGSLVGGTFAAQLTTSLSAIVLTRLYTVGDMASFGLFLASTSIVTAIASLRYEQAIVVAGANRDAVHTACVSMAATIVLAMAASAVIPAASGALVQYFPGGRPMSAWFVPLVILIFGSNQILQLWATREQVFTQLAASKFAAAAGISLAQIGGALAGARDASMLIDGYLIGILIQSLVLAANIQWKPFVSEAFRMTLRDAKSVAIRHRAFPLYAVPSALLTTLGAQGLTIWLTMFFPRSLVGIYVVMHRVLSLPNALVSQAVAPAVYARLAAGTVDHRAFVGAAFGASVAGAAPIAAIFAVVAPAAFEIAFGAPYREAGSYARIVLPAYVLMFASLPLTTSFFAFGKQLAGLVWSACFVAATAAVVGAQAHFGTFRGAIGAYAAVSCVFYALVYIMAMRWAGASWPEMISRALDGGRRARAMCREFFREAKWRAAQ